MLVYFTYNNSNLQQIFIDLENFFIVLSIANIQFPNLVCSHCLLFYFLSLKEIKKIAAILYKVRNLIIDSLIKIKT